MHQLFRHLLLIIIVFTFVITMSGEGLASCGDWLADSADASSSMQSHSSSEVATSKSAPIQNTPTPACSGSQCRQVPFTPMQSTPFEIELKTNDSLLNLIAAKREASSRRSMKWRHLDDATMTGHRETLERPPQFIA